MADNAASGDMGRQHTGEKGGILLPHVIAGEVSPRLLPLDNGKAGVGMGRCGLRCGNIALAADKDQPVDLGHDLGHPGANGVLLIAHARDHRDLGNPLRGGAFSALQGAGVKARVLHLAHEENGDFHLGTHWVAACTRGVHWASCAST